MYIMTNTTIMQKNIAFVGTLSALFFVLLFGIGSLSAHAATISRQLDLGSTGQDVSTLQTYLSTNANWYPSGLVTGYFGNLTQGGVQKFQTAQGIVTSGTPATTGYGRVGPATLTEINEFLSSGSSNQSTLYTVPVLSPLSIRATQTTVTLSWTTNEPTIGQAYWSTSPIQSDEATGPHQTPYVSGTLALDAGGLQTNHTITISNLQPNTLYHVFTRSIDASGDMTLTLDNTFQTTN
jgi:peptidoglycan hydrolase-like protein with peptidoglycan-binding domain